MLDDRKARLRRRMEDILTLRDVDAIDDLYAPHVVRRAGPPLPALQGLAAYKEYMSRGAGIYSDLELTIDDIICEADRCALCYRLAMTHTGYNPVFDLPPSGRRATLNVTARSRWEGDKIVEEWVVADFAGFLQQLDAAPMPYTS
jgi:predicted ester cyclase